jgi:hypothetical protein
MLLRNFGEIVSETYGFIRVGVAIPFHVREVPSSYLDRRTDILVVAFVIFLGLSKKSVIVLSNRPRPLQYTSFRIYSSVTLTLNALKSELLTASLNKL